MADPPRAMSGDQICPVCNRPKSQHTPEEIMACSKKMIESENMRYCSTCGMTSPEEGVHDRCGRCGEKYPFVNE